MFGIRKDGFYIDGKPFRIYSGAMHYFRILPGYWDDRFAKMKAAGFNAVETVMCWNMHEPREGKFCFEGNYDIAAYCQGSTRGSPTSSSRTALRAAAGPISDKIIVSYYFFFIKIKLFYYSLVLTVWDGVSRKTAFGSLKINKIKNELPTCA